VRGLAQGGFGQTYIAEDQRRPGHPQCVVKQLQPENRNSRLLETAERLFFAEAEALEHLGNHEQIPRLLAYFQEGNEFYLIQEFIDGQTLTHEIKLGEPWSEDKVYELLRSVLQILAFIHQNGVIHRDIKPDNIIRRYADQQLVLVDFGTVKQVRSHLTSQGQMVPTVAIGTPGYMPTEQNRGNPRPNSDIYALGIVGIQAATGLSLTQLQEDPETGELIWQPWAKVSSQLAAVLSQMVRYHFKDRYQSAVDVLKDLEASGAITSFSVPTADEVAEDSPRLPSPGPTVVVNPTPDNVTQTPPNYTQPQKALPLGAAPVQSASSGNYVSSAQPTSIDLSAQSQNTSSTPAYSRVPVAQPSAAPQQGNNRAGKNKNKFLYLLAIPALLFLGYGVFKLMGNGTSSTISERVSSGDKLLIEEIEAANSAFYDAREEGIAAMADEEYEAAAEAFQTALDEYRNAPQTVIYKNNAEIGDDTAYEIAIAVPINNETEGGANDAQELLRGIAQAQTEINKAGGIDGTPLKVIIADDDSDQNIAKQVAEAFVDNEDILGVVGHYSSDTSLAASEVYQEEGLVMISPTSTSTELSTKGDYIFRSLTTDSFNTAALSRYMTRILAKENAAIFYNPGDYSEGLRELFKKELDFESGEVVAEFDLSKGDFNADAAVAEAIDNGAEIIALFHSSKFLNTALAVIEANQNQLSILSGDSGYKPEMYKISDYTTDTLVVTVPWNLLGGNEDSSFSKAARQLWGADVSWRTAMSYDATQALIAAIKQSDSRSGVQAALLDPGFAAEGVEGPIQFQSTTGDRDGSPKLVTVGPNPKSPGEYRFVLVED
ncbi:MAG: bifunctional serine/threonine-protein kinase/ABC transporter substrate-binding protein, partial [Cyanobacteria bacterium J06635_15]